MIYGLLPNSSNFDTIKPETAISNTNVIQFVLMQTLLQALQVWYLVHFWSTTLNGKVPDIEDKKINDSRAAFTAEKI